MPNRTTVAVLSESGADFLEANGLQARNVDRQPAGLNFYEQRWPRSGLGSVRVEHGEHSFELGGVVSLSGVEDAVALDRGVYEFSVRARLAGQDGRGSHDDIRLAFIQLLTKLRGKGWQRYIEPGAPRLTGQRALVHQREDAAYGLDADYELSLKEWLALGAGRFSWEFHVEGVFLTLAFQRDSRVLAQREPGSTLIGLRVHRVEERGRSMVAPEERDRWRHFLPGRLERLRARRDQLEAELRRRGVAIWEQYQDPPLL